MDRNEQVIYGFREVVRKWIWLNKRKMDEALDGYTPSEVHCIDYVGRHDDSNVTKLAAAFHMTRGAISKMTKKLIARGLLDSYQKPENRKELYFVLTVEGAAVKRLHEQLHREVQERDKAVFDKLSEKEFAQMMRFVETYNRHLDAKMAERDANALRQMESCAK